MSKKRIGDVVRVANAQRKFGSADEYNFVRLQMPSGNECEALFTDAEIQTATDRANANPEDLPEVSWIRDAID